MSGSAWGLVLLVSAVIYIIYLAVIRAFLLKKAGRKSWKAFIPVLSLREEYIIAGRPKWFWAHLLTMLPAEFFAVTAAAAMIQMQAGTGSLTDAQTAHLCSILLGLAVVLLLFSLPARIIKAYGLQRRFGENPDLDYAIGLIIFTWAFKARFAFSKKLSYVPDAEPVRRKRKKHQLFHFFPQYKSVDMSDASLQNCHAKSKGKAGKKKKQRKNKQKR